MYRLLEYWNLCNIQKSYPETKHTFIFISYNWFWILGLHPTNLLSSFGSSNTCSVNSLEYPVYNSMSFANRDSFKSRCFLFHFSCLVELTITSKTLQKRKVTTIFLFLIFGEKHSVFNHQVLAKGFSFRTFIILRMIQICCYFVKCFLLWKCDGFC